MFHLEVPEQTWKRKTDEYHSGAMSNDDDAVVEELLDELVNDFVDDEEDASNWFASPFSGPVMPIATMDDTWTANLVPADDDVEGGCPSNAKPPLVEEEKQEDPPLQHDFIYHPPTSHVVVETAPLTNVSEYYVDEATALRDADIEATLQAKIAAATDAKAKLEADLAALAYDDPEAQPTPDIAPVAAHAQENRVAELAPAPEVAAVEEEAAARRDAEIAEAAAQAKKNLVAEIEAAAKAKEEAEARARRDAEVAEAAAQAKAKLVAEIEAAGKVRLEAELGGDAEIAQAESHD